MFSGSTNRITGLHYTYECAAVIAAYLCKLYLENHSFTLELWVSHFMCRLCLLVLPKESLCFTTRMGAPLYVQPIFVSSTERITVLHCTYGFLTLCVAYVYGL